MPYYHLMQDRLRALETGKNWIHVSANGPTALIDSKGRIVKHTRKNRQEVIEVTLSY